LLLLLQMVLDGGDLGEAVRLRAGDLISEVGVAVTGIEGGGDCIRMMQVRNAAGIAVTRRTGVGVDRVRTLRL